MTRLWRFECAGEELMTEEVYAEDQCGADCDENQQAPTGSQAIFANKNLAQARWLRGRNRLAGGCEERRVLVQRSLV